MSSDFKIQHKNSICIISCPKRLDIQNSDELKNILMDTVNQNIYKIIMDLTRTGYIDSSGLGAIVSIISTVRANGGDIRLVTRSHIISNLLEITQLNKVLKCYKTLQQGIDSFNS